MKVGVPYGKYVLMGRLSKGGMAEIFLAKSTAPNDSGKLLAIKRTLPEYGGDREFLSMFLDEAYISTSLVHPNICRVSDTGQNGKELYMVMEFLHGKDLRMIVKKLAKEGREMPPIFVAHILTKIARALYYAHTKCDPIDGKAQNIVHRDVNPQNILISYDGIPKLIDFGIAKAKDRVSKTRAGVLKGKFSYLSPEQVLGHPVDGRSDVFALGVVLYSLLVGSRPFEARGEPALLLKISQGKYTAARELKPDLDPELDAIIEKALQKEVSDRYDSAAQMADDLDGYLQKFPAVTDADLGLFVRELYQEEYERELEQIKGYQIGEGPVLEEGLDTAEATGVEQTVAITQIDEVSQGLVAMATGLAAGFDSEKVTTLNEESSDCVPAKDSDSVAVTDFDPNATQMLSGHPEEFLGNAQFEFKDSATEISKKSPNPLGAQKFDVEQVPAWDADATMALPSSDLAGLEAMQKRSQNGVGVGAAAVLDREDTLRDEPVVGSKKPSSSGKGSFLSAGEVGVLIAAALAGLGMVYWLYTAKVNSPQPFKTGQETTVIELMQP